MNDRLQIYFRDAPGDALELVVARGHGAEVHFLDETAIASLFEKLSQHVSRNILRKVSPARKADTGGVESDGNVIELPPRGTR